MRAIAALVFVFYCSIVAVAVPAESNAQRLARGLPPLRPNFGRTKPGFMQSFDDPTPIFGAKRSLPSITPSTFTGQIEVRKSNGHSIGMIKNWQGIDPINGIVQSDPQHTLHVTFTTTYVQTNPFDIFATNALFQAPYFVGLAGHGSIGHGTSASVEFTNVNQTPAWSPPVGGVESAVWFFNSQTKELWAQWINPDGSTPWTFIGFEANDNKFIVTGDIDQWNHDNPGKHAHRVHFFLVPV